MIKAEIRIDYLDERTARAVFDALGPDNGGYVESVLEGASIVLRAESETAGTMKNTADDLMACIKAAEDSIEATGQPN
jgi:hypothetical protein